MGYRYELQGRLKFSIYIYYSHPNIPSNRFSASKKPQLLFIIFTNKSTTTLETTTSLVIPIINSLTLAINCHPNHQIVLNQCRTSTNPTTISLHDQNNHSISNHQTNNSTTLALPHHKKHHVTPCNPRTPYLDMLNRTQWIRSSQSNNHTITKQSTQHNNITPVKPAKPVALATSSSMEWSIGCLG